jgi:hypothetical protein
MKATQVEFAQTPFGDCWWQIKTSSDQVVAGQDYANMRQAVASFKQFCKVVDARGPFEFTGNAKEEAHKLLIA